MLEIVAHMSVIDSLGQKMAAYQCKTAHLSKYSPCLNDVYDLRCQFVAMSIT